MTAEHLRLVIESVPDTAAFRISPKRRSPLKSSLCCVWDVLLLFRSLGGVRGIVCGDLVRRLVARSIVQQISSAVEEATSPFQHALTTKAGGECMAHAIQSLTDLDSRVT